MKVGQIRRVVVPSPLAYVDRTLEPVPRRPAFRQRLYGTVLNDTRRTQEQIGLGGGNAAPSEADLADLQKLLGRS